MFSSMTSYAYKLVGPETSERWHFLSCHIKKGEKTCIMSDHLLHQTRKEMDLSLAEILVSKKQVPYFMSHLLLYLIVMLLLSLILIQLAAVLKLPFSYPVAWKWFHSNKNGAGFLAQDAHRDGERKPSPENVYHFFSLTISADHPGLASTYNAVLRMPVLKPPAARFLLSMIEFFGDKMNGIAYAGSVPASMFTRYANIEHSSFGFLYPSQKFLEDSTACGSASQGHDCNVDAGSVFYSMSTGGMCAFARDNQSIEDLSVSKLFSKLFAGNFGAPPSVNCTASVASDSVSGAAGTAGAVVGTLLMAEPLGPVLAAGLAVLFGLSGTVGMGIHISNSLKGCKKQARSERHEQARLACLSTMIPNDAPSQCKDLDGWM